MMLSQEFLELIRRKKRMEGKGTYLPNAYQMLTGHQSLQSSTLDMLSFNLCIIRDLFEVI